VAQGCAVYEPKDGIVVLFNDGAEKWTKDRFSAVGSLFSDSLLDLAETWLTQCVHVFERLFFGAGVSTGQSAIE